MIKKKNAGGAALKMRCAMKSYSMFDFIRAIRDRTLLWNHNDEHFHNRLEREKMWHEIAAELLSNFEHSKTSDKQTIVQTLQKRWKNSRDSYLRAQRLKQTNSEERSYIYEKELSFLLHCKDDSGQHNDKNVRDVRESKLNTSDESHAANTSRKVVDTTKKRNSAAALNEKSTKQKPSASSGGGTMTKSRIASSQKKRRNSVDSNFSFDAEMEEVCQEIENQLQGVTNAADASDKTSSAIICGSQLKTTENENHSNNSISSTSKNNHNIQQTFTNTGEPDPDQAFFDSIKPNIRKMSAEQKLDFQIEILKLIKNFSSNKR